MNFPIPANAKSTFKVERYGVGAEVMSLVTAKSPLMQRRDFTLVALLYLPTIVERIIGIPSEALLRSIGSKGHIPSTPGVSSPETSPAMAFRQILLFGKRFGRSLDGPKR